MGWWNYVWQEWPALGWALHAVRQLYECVLSSGLSFRKWGGLKLVPWKV